MAEFDIDHFLCFNLRKGKEKKIRLAFCQVALIHYHRESDCKREREKKRKDSQTSLKGMFFN